MNVKLVKSLAQIILSLSEEERQLLEKQVNSPELSSKIAQKNSQDILELEKRLQAFEAQCQMQSEDFYQLFRAGKLGDSIDFFEWSVFYEMWNNGKQQLKLLETQRA